MAKLKKKKRSVDPSEDFIRKLKQLSSGLIHMAATLDFQYRSSGSLFDGTSFDADGCDEIIRYLGVRATAIQTMLLVLHESSHPINQDAADRIADMEIPT